MKDFGGTCIKVSPVVSKHGGVRCSVRGVKQCSLIEIIVMLFTLNGSLQRKVLSSVGVVMQKLVVLLVCDRLFVDRISGGHNSARQCRTDGSTQYCPEDGAGVPQNKLGFVGVFIN